MINGFRAAVESRRPSEEPGHAPDPYRAPPAKFSEALSVIIGLYFFTRHFEAYE